MTPHAHKLLRKTYLTDLAEIRADLRQARALRATGRILDAEDAEGLIAWAWHKHNIVRSHIRLYRSTVPVKFENVSPNAQARRAARIP